MACYFVGPAIHIHVSIGTEANRKSANHSQDHSREGHRVQARRAGARAVQDDEKSEPASDRDPAASPLLFTSKYSFIPSINSGKV